MTDIATRLATRSRRLLGSLIDGALQVIVIAAIVIAIASGATTKMPDLQNLSSSQQLFALVATVISVWAIFFVLHGYLLATRGQTIGKYLMKTRIVDLAGNVPALQRSLLRRYFVTGAIMQIPIIGGLIGLINPLMIFKKNRRCLHDYIAGTQVIEATGMYAVITNSALRVIGAAALSVSIFFALWSRSHSPNMGFGEMMTKIDSFVLREPIYYIIIAVSALIAICGVISIVLSFKTAPSIPPSLPSSGTKLDELAKAKQLLDSGAIDASEYQKIKDSLLDK